MSPAERPGRPVRSRSGLRGHGTCSTRAAPSRSCTRCWCCSPPRRSDSRPRGRWDWRSSGRARSALVLSRFSFALRGRALLWLAALARCRCSSRGARRRCSQARSPATLFFTVVVWGSVYYHLRTGAPWTNGLRFWRLVLTNSDPTSGNALEQLPKLLIALSAGTLLAEDPGAGSLLRVGAAAGDRRCPGRARRARLRAPPAALSGAAAARARRGSRSPGGST